MTPNLISRSLYLIVIYDISVHMINFLISRPSSFSDFFGSGQKEVLKNLSRQNKLYIIRPCVKSFTQLSTLIKCFMKSKPWTDRTEPPQVSNLTPRSTNIMMRKLNSLDLDDEDDDDMSRVCNRNVLSTGVMKDPDTVAKSIISIVTSTACVLSVSVTFM